MSLSQLRAQGPQEELLSQAEVIKTNPESWEGRMGSQTETWLGNWCV